MTQATRVELQKWLDQFPEDAVIEVITTAESGRWGYEPYISAYESQLELIPMPDDFVGYFCGHTFEVEKLSDKLVIRLGKKE
jgi:hypothetical protein